MLHVLFCFVCGVLAWIYFEVQVPNSPCWPAIACNYHMYVVWLTSWHGAWLAYSTHSAGDVLMSDFTMQLQIMLKNPSKKNPSSEPNKAAYDEEAKDAADD